MYLFASTGRDLWLAEFDITNDLLGAGCKLAVTNWFLFSRFCYEHMQDDSQ
jgi:hypothetical protein